MAANGRLAPAELTPIPGGQLENHAAASWMRLRAHIGQATGVWICPTSSRCSYRPYADQLYFWNLYVRHRGSLAARPGTSNHGWGLAVDTATPRMAQLINQLGASYGWQKRWSDAPSEWWHFKYAPDNDQHRDQEPPHKPRHTHPYHYMTDGEQYWRNVLIRERRIAKRNGGWDKVGGNHVVMAGRAKHNLRKKMSAIQDAAASSGWGKFHRKERYDYMKKLVAG